MKIGRLLFTLVGISLCSNLLAATVIWDGETNSDWNTATNWSTNTVPTTGDAAVIGDLPSPNPNVTKTNGLVINSSGANPLSLTINNPNFSLTTSGGSAFIGSTATGIVNINNSTWSHTSPGGSFLTLGSTATGNGTINITNNGRLISSGNVFVGAAASGSGTINLTNGQWTGTNGAAFVGNSGTGVVNINNSTWTQTFVASTLLSIGANATGNGTVNLSNNGRLITSGGDAFVGAFGRGLVTIDQSTWTHTSGAFRLGNSSTTSNGTVNISNNGQLSTSGGTAFIGNAGTGTVTINQGTWTHTGDLRIANNSTSTGTVSLSNNAQLNTTGTAFVAVNGIGTLTLDHSSWIHNGALQLTNAATGNGTLNILNGSQLTSGNGTASIGASGTGTVTVDNSVWTHSNEIIVASAGTGTLRVLNQGTLATNRISAGSGIRLVNFNNGTLTALQNDTSFINNFTDSQFTISNNFFLNSNGFNVGTDSSIISGTGNLIKIGAGALTIVGNQIYTGMTVVGAGSLILNGTITSNTLVNPSGILAGRGTIFGDLTVNGTVSPGNSIGTLTVVGNYVQAPGSSYVAEINASGQSDLIHASGTATIQSGTSVYAVPDPGPYVFGTQYTILTADGGVSGRYTSLVQSAALSPFLALMLLYDANNVYLRVVLSGSTFNSFAQTPNQLAVANAASTLGVGNAVYDALSNINDPALFRHSLDLLSGEIHATVSSLYIQESQYLREAVLNRLSQSVVPQITGYNPLQVVQGENGSAIWGQAFGGWGELDGNSNTAKANSNIQGFLIGSDTTLGPSRVGVVGGYSQSDFNLHQRQSQGNSNNYSLGLYAASQVKNIKLKAGGAYTWLDIDTSRSINFPGISNSVAANYSGNGEQVFLEAGYPLSVLRMPIEPFVRGAYVNVSSGFMEKGGAPSLRGTSSMDVFFSTLGLRQNSLLYHNGIEIGESALLGWQHAYNNVNPQGIFSFATGSSLFLIEGAPIAKDALLIDAGIDFTRPTKNINFRLAYLGLLAQQATENGITGTLSWRFN